MDNARTTIGKVLVRVKCFRYIKSYLLSDYEEMKLAGISDEAIEKCKAGRMGRSIKPELQKHLTYPTENTYPLTAKNVTKLDN